MARISGMNFDVNMGDTLVHVEKATLDITDNSAVAQTGGVPDGHVDGDVTASGELELDSANFALVM
ncbi:phage protein, partial [Klebsiella pneumoniae]